MFENRTYEALIEEALSLITEDIDKQEGSIIRTAISPCIYKLAETYVQLDNLIDLVFGDTASGEYLNRVVSDYGIERKLPTFAIRKVITTGTVALGTRWSLEETTYEITALLSMNTYSARCEQIGVIGNKYSGPLEALDSVGEVTATISDIITAGQDEEADDNLRERFYTQVRSAPTSGNAYHYKKWSLEVTGVGDAKIYPLWNGPGTVKVVIVDNDKQPASASLTEITAAHIEEVRPIGAKVTVVSGTGKQINISATVSLASGHNLQNVITEFTKTVTEYFKSIAFSLAYVSIAKIGTILLSTDGVLDYSNLQLNGKFTNLTLTNEEIPILGIADLEV